MKFIVLAGNMIGQNPIGVLVAIHAGSGAMDIFWPALTDTINP